MARSATGGQGGCVRFARRRARAAAAIAIFLAACGVGGEQSARSPAEAGKALFEEKCRTVAGEKIYRRVEDVEGILLLKVRPQRRPQDEADPMWPGAAFALEASGNEYIETFLGYEHSSSPKGEPVTPTRRGYITTDYQLDNASNLPGYRWVDVIDEKDGNRYRYSGSWKAVGRKDTSAPNVQLELRKDPNYDLNVYRYILDRQVGPDPAPRYGVTFEDHVVPEDRALGLASSTVRVIDLQTNEVLGEMLRYAWGPRGAGPTGASAWLSAWKCPGHPVGAEAATRKFVDQVLIPKKER